MTLWVALIYLEGIKSTVTVLGVLSEVQQAVHTTCDSCIFPIAIALRAKKQPHVVNRFRWANSPKGTQ